MSSEEAESTAATTFTVTGWVSVQSLHREPGEPPQSHLYTWTRDEDTRKMKWNDYSALTVDQVERGVYRPDLKAHDAFPDILSRGEDGFWDESGFSAKHRFFGEETAKEAEAIMKTDGTFNAGQTRLLEVRLFPDHLTRGISIITPSATKRDEHGVTTKCANFTEAGKISRGLCHLAEFKFERIPDSERHNYHFENKTTMVSRLLSFGGKLANPAL